MVEARKQIWVTSFLSQVAYCKLGRTQNKRKGLPTALRAPSHTWLILIRKTHFRQGNEISSHNFVRQLKSWGFDQKKSNQPTTYPPINQPTEPLPVRHILLRCMVAGDFIKMPDVLSGIFKYHSFLLKTKTVDLIQPPPLTPPQKKFSLTYPHLPCGLIWEIPLAVWGESPYSTWHFLDQHLDYQFRIFQAAGT